MQGTARNRWWILSFPSFLLCSQCILSIVGGWNIFPEVWPCSQLLFLLGIMGNGIQHIWNPGRC